MQLSTLSVHPQPGYQLPKWTQSLSLEPKRQCRALSLPISSVTSVDPWTSPFTRISGSTFYPFQSGSTIFQGKPNGQNPVKG